MEKFDRLAIRSLVAAAGVAVIGQSANAAVIDVTGNINLNSLSNSTTTEFDLYSGSTYLGYSLTFAVGTAQGVSTDGCSYTNSGDTNACNNDYIAWTLSNGTLTLTIQNTGSFGVIAGQKNGVNTDLYLNYILATPTGTVVTQTGESYTVNNNGFSNSGLPAASATYARSWVCSNSLTTCQNGANGQGSGAVAYLNPQVTASGSGPWPSGVATASGLTQNTLMISKDIGASATNGSNNSAFNVGAVTETYQISAAQPAPEPASVTAFGVGVAGAAIARRWRRKSARGGVNDNRRKAAA